MAATRSASCWRHAVHRCHSGVRPVHWQLLPHRERAQYIIATSIPLFFLASLSLAGGDDPRPLVWLTQLLPTTSGINLMVHLNQMDASLAEVSHELITLAVLLVLYSALALWRLHSQKGTEGGERRNPLRP